MVGPSSWQVVVALKNTRNAKNYANVSLDKSSFPKCRNVSWAVTASVN